MAFITKLFLDGILIFGYLFPALFLLALSVLSIVTYELLCRIGGIASSEVNKCKTASIIEGLCTLTVLLGSLQTIISLCIVGFSLCFGALQVGTKAFAILIQGFASTGFGIAVSILGKGHLQLFHTPNTKPLMSIIRKGATQ